MGIDFRPAGPPTKEHDLRCFGLRSFIAPNIMLAGAIVFLLVGGISVLLGFKARIGASLLAVFLILATYYFHDFWTYEPDSQVFQIEMIQFMKNLGLMGAMLMIVANGSGPASLGNRTEEDDLP